MKKNQRGFLLLEFLIVLALVVILSGMLALSFVSVAQAKNEQNALQAVKELVASENNWHAVYGGGNNPGGFQYATGDNTHWLTDCAQPPTATASCLANPALLTPGVAYNQFLFSVQDAPQNGYTVYAVPKVSAAGRLGFCGGNNPLGGTNNILYQFPPTAFPMSAFGLCQLPDVAKSGTDQGPAGQSIKGEKGIQGEPGIGHDGANCNPCVAKDGTAATIDGITVAPLPYGSVPTVNNSGTPQHAVFNFGIPGGQPGTNGHDGVTTTNNTTLSVQMLPINGSISGWICDACSATDQNHARVVPAQGTYNWSTGNACDIGTLTYQCGSKAAVDAPVTTFYVYAQCTSPDSISGSSGCTIVGTLPVTIQLYNGVGVIATCGGLTQQVDKYAPNGSGNATGLTWKKSCAISGTIHSGDWLSVAFTGNNITGQQLNVSWEIF